VDSNLVAVSLAQIVVRRPVIQRNSLGVACLFPASLFRCCLNCVVFAVTRAACSCSPQLSRVSAHHCVFDSPSPFVSLVVLLRFAFRCKMLLFHIRRTTVVIGEGVSH
jgi:hypothetical protein